MNDPEKRIQTPAEAQVQRTLAEIDDLTAKFGKCESVDQMVDLYISVVDDGVQKQKAADIREGADAGYASRVDTYWKSFRSNIEKVRKKIKYAGLVISEEIDSEGSFVLVDGPGGVPDPRWMPDREKILILIWPDGHRVPFQGDEAQVAFSFMQWYSTYADSFRKMVAQKKGENQSRIINPGDPEHKRYFDAKEAGDK